MKIMVTGCAGLVGWAISRLLLNQGRDVVGVDSMNDAYDVRLKEWRLAQLQDHDRFEFARVDVTSPSALASVFSAGPFEAVINLAARAGVRRSIEIPATYYETNLMAVLHLMDACREHGINKFVQASTSSVYGDSDMPFREDLPADRPISPYAASKRAAEMLCYTYHRLHGLDVSVLRFFTVYGPAGRPDMAPLRFVRWIAEGEPLNLYGTGEQKRDFTYVDDIAAGAVAALKPMGFETINLGSDQPASINSVIGMIEEMVGRKADIRHSPAHPADPFATWADISRARSLLGWEPRTDLREGFRQTVNWYMENRDWARRLDLG